MSSIRDPGQGGSATTYPYVEVYWRPGCPYCSRLRRELDRRGMRSRWHNIWEDEVAAEFVRAANRGNETVPTVRVGSQSLTNPSWPQLESLLSGGAAAGHHPGHHPDRQRGRLASWLRARTR